MGAGVSDELGLAKHVVLVAHRAIAPAVRAEKVQAGEATEGEELHEYPYGSFGRFAVLAHEVAAESVFCEHGHLALTPAAFVVAEA